MLPYPFSQFLVNIYTLLVDFITYFWRCVYILVGIKEKQKSFCLLDFRLILEGWVVGFEPTTFRTTIWRSNQLNYIHHVGYFFLASAKVRVLFGLTKYFPYFFIKTLYFAGAAGVWVAGATGAFADGAACFCWLAPKLGKLLGFVVLSCCVAAFSITLSSVGAEGAT